MRNFNIILLSGFIFLLLLNINLFANETDISKLPQDEIDAIKILFPLADFEQSAEQKLDPDIDDIYWSDKFFHSGISSQEINAITIFNGDLIVGGNFLFADGKRVSRIARWDGTEWHGLGGGVNHYVSDLIVFDNKLIACGPFTMAGELEVGYIASWDGNSWSTLGDGFNSTVRDLEIFQGKLLASGIFDYAGDVYAKYLAEWDGQTWSPVYEVTSTFWIGGQLTVFDGCLYAINARGFFDDKHQPIVKWDGTTWESLPVGPHNIHSMTSYNGELVIGGYFIEVGEVAANSIAAWNGSSWHPLGEGLNTGQAGSPSIRGLFDYNGLLIAGGNFLYTNSTRVNCIAQWDGNSWSPIGNGAEGDMNYNGGIVTALGVYNNNLIAGGYFNQMDSSIINHIASWDGNGWSAISGKDGYGVYGTIRAFTEFGGGIIAAGDFSSAGREFISNLARWTGHDWMPFGENIIGSIRALEVYNNELYVGGHFIQIGDQSFPNSGIIKWNGTSWEIICQYDYSYGDITFEIYDNKLIVAGPFNSINGVPINGIAQWDGTDWSSLGDGIIMSIYSVTNMTVYYGSLVVAGGGISQAGNIPAQGIAIWNGTSWSTIEIDVEHSLNITDVDVYGGQLVIGGEFAEINGVQTGPLALWDGSSWSALSDVPLEYNYTIGIEGIEVIGNNLFVTGVFDNAGEIILNNIARWDGASWHPLGSGIDYIYEGTLYASNNNSLFIGGYISTAGGKESYGIAQWTQRICGDVDGDDILNILDIVYLINYLYKDGPSPQPSYAGDINANGIVELADIIYLIRYIYESLASPNCL